jgi:[ribosomal protein S5]-alanine N-acetyltransferase
MTVTIAAPLIAAERLETDRMILRRPAVEDFEGLHAFSASERTRFTGGPRSPRQSFDRLTAFAGHWLMRGYGRYIVCNKAEGLRPMGHVGVFQHDVSFPPELAWTIWSAEDEGKGYARESAAAVIDHFRARAVIPELVAIIHRDNAGSIAVARALGGTLSATPAWREDLLRFDFPLKAEAA